MLSSGTVIQSTLKEENPVKKSLQGEFMQLRLFYVTRKSEKTFKYQGESRVQRKFSSGTAVWQPVHMSSSPETTVTAYGSLASSRELQQQPDSHRLQVRVVNSHRLPERVVSSHHQLQTRDASEEEKTT